MAYKPSIVYFLALYRNSLPTPIMMTWLSWRGPESDLCRELKLWYDSHPDRLWALQPWAEHSAPWGLCPGLWTKEVWVHETLRKWVVRKVGKGIMNAGSTALFSSFPELTRYLLLLCAICSKPQQLSGWVRSWSPLEQNSHLSWRSRGCILSHQGGSSSPSTCPHYPFPTAWAAGICFWCDAEWTTSGTWSTHLGELEMSHPCLLMILFKNYLFPYLREKAGVLEQDLTY